MGCLCSRIFTMASVHSGNGNIILMCRSLPSIPSLALDQFLQSLHNVTFAWWKCPQWNFILAIQDSDQADWSAGTTWRARIRTKGVWNCVNDFFKQYKLQTWSSVLLNTLILLLTFIGDGLALHETHLLFFQSYLYFSAAPWLRSSPQNVNRSSANHSQS